MKKITGKLSLQWRLTLITALPYDSHLHSDVFFISQSAVAGMENLGDYMIRIDNTDSAPITFNMDPSVLFPELSDQLQLTKTVSHQRTHGNRDHHPSQQHLHLFYQPSGITSRFADSARR